ALFVVNDAADGGGAALARRRQPVRRNRTARQHPLALGGEFGAAALVGGEIIAVLAALPAIGEVFAEMVVAARHPVAEGAEQLPRQRQERGVVGLLLLAQARIEVFAGLAVADLHEALRVIEAGAPDFD